MSAPKFYSVTDIPDVGSRDTNGVYFLRTASGYYLKRVDETVDKNVVDLHIDWANVDNKQVANASNGGYLSSTDWNTFNNTSTNAFKQNGNSFGAIASLGTNDAYDLNIKTNGITRASFLSGGAVLINTTTYNTKDKLQVEGTASATSLAIYSEHIYGTPAYHYTNGTFIQTDIPATVSVMWELYIKGNGYSGDVPINTQVQGYLYQTLSTIRYTKAINCGANIAAVQAFLYNGYLCFWLSQTDIYQTLRFSLATSYNVGYRITSITNAAKPASGTSWDVTITPEKSWREGNDGSGSGLDADLLDGQQGSYYQSALSGTGIVKSTAGVISYLTDNSANWNIAYSWGNHASAGYLTYFTESDPTVPAYAKTLTAFSVIKTSTDALYLPLSGGRVNGYAAFGATPANASQTVLIRPIAVNKAALNIQALASQTENLQNWTNNDDSVLSYIDFRGNANFATDTYTAGGYDLLVKNATSGLQEKIPVATVVGNTVILNQSAAAQTSSSFWITGIGYASAFNAYNGFWLAQSGTFTFNDVTGEYDNRLEVVSGAGNWKFSSDRNGFAFVIDQQSLSADRTYTVPNATGTFALQEWVIAGYLSKANGGTVANDVIVSGGGENKAALKVDSSTQGFMPPRMNNSERSTFASTLSSEDDGMIVYDREDAKWYGWDGSAWQQFN